MKRCFSLNQIDRLGFIKGNNNPVLLTTIEDVKYYIPLHRYDSLNFEEEVEEEIEAPLPKDEVVLKSQYQEMVLEYERKLHALKQSHEHEVFELKQEALDEGVKRISSVYSPVESPQPSEISDEEDAPKLDFTRIPFTKPTDEQVKSESKKKKIEKLIEKKNSLPKTSERRDSKKWK